MNQAFSAILAVILVAILVIVAIFLFQTLGETFPSTARSVVNETGTITTTPYSLAGASDCNYAAGAITTAINRTSGAIIPAVNYTLSDLGYVTNATTYVYSNVSFTYTYTSGGDSCDASAATVAQFATYPALVGLVGTIVFLGLVIGVLVGSFLFGGRKEQI